MELCKGSLYDEIIKGKVDYQRGIEFFAQLIEAVAYMHGQHVIHKDLSSSNVFLDESSSRVKVGDFGIAKIGTTDLHPTSLGNQQYEAPERSNGVDIDAKVDMFSLGKLLLELISNISTASERARIFEGFSKEGVLPACLYQEDGELGEDGKLILSLTSVDPRDRPSAEEVSLMLKRRTVV
ncbi:hypothetical protein MKW92_022937 [Papaver armeniacum]|nr:hypothetical protein MKW92_022937 [Papaver armeniacum]